MSVLRKIITPLAAVAALHGEAFAGCNASACSSQVDRLYVFNDGRVEVLLDDTQAEFNELGCVVPNGNRLALPTSDAGVLDRMYSALLTAKASDEAVYVAIVTASNPCEVRYVRSQ
ncbi:MAG: hypothetical protein AAF224_14230 [Pseudomonadota bacterium]